LKQYQDEKRRALKKFQQQQNVALGMAYFSAATNFAGAAFSKPSPTGNQSAAFNAGNGPVSSSYANKLVDTGNLPSIYTAGLGYKSFGPIGFKANGGLIKRFAAGGSVFGGDTLTDNVPAMLMGGEFVLNNNSTNRIGVDRLNYMNKTGKVAGYASGGYVGNYNSTVAGDSSNKYLTELISINSQIRDSLASKSSNGSIPNQTGSSINITNQITVTVTEGGKVSSQANSQADGKSDSKSGNNNKEEQGRQISKVIENAINQALIKESRNGGILESTFKKR
jgi:hypothetical protein